jgi:hypothetical protein
MNTVEAHRLFRQIAVENRQRHDDNNPHWQGIAFQLDVRTYGQALQL